MTIDELIAQFGYTRRTIHTDENGGNFDSNLGFIKAGTDTPGNYHLRDIGSFILVEDIKTGFGCFCIYNFGDQGDHAYDGTEEWKEAEKQRLGLSDAELELKIWLDTILDPWFEDEPESDGAGDEEWILF